MSNMSELGNLWDALKLLNRSVSDFPIGAISLEDFKPIEEKIKNTRESLKHLNARLLIHNAQNGLREITGEPEESMEDTVGKLQDAIASTLISSKAIKLCLHSHTIQAILMGTEGDADMQNKIYAYLCKLFTLNDNILSVQEEISEAIKEQLELKIECENALFDYKKFLKEQEEICDKQLEEINPELAQRKAKVNKTVKNINLMKSLIVSLITASHHTLLEHPEFEQMLENHCDLIDIETILKIARGNADDESTPLNI